MLDLIARLETATGPDRELDVLVFAEQDNRDTRWDGNKLIGRSRKLPHDECWLGYIDPGRTQRNFHSLEDCRRYTSSIDAALTLVPDGWEASSSGPSYNSARNAVDEFFGYVRERDARRRPDAEGACHHRVRAIALCIAALKARAALSSNSRGSSENA